MSKQHSIAVALAIIIGPAVAPAPALAQPAAAQAETLFRQGKDLLAKGQIAEACAAFDASQKLAPTVATMLNQASCREKNGQLATAWGLFIEAERQTRAAADEPTRQLHQVAASHAAKLEPRLSTLTITVAPENRVGGLQVLRNAEPVDPGAWNKALPIDGGSYKITASAPGNAEWSSMITVGDERDARTIEIPKLKAAALQPAHVSPPPTSPHPVTTEPAPVAAPSRSRVAPFAVGGAAIALAGGALGFQLWASSLHDQSLAEKTDNDRRIALWNSANTRRYIGDAMGVASIACAGVAVWLYLRSSGDEPSSASTAARMQITPVIDGNGTGLAVVGRY